MFMARFARILFCSAMLLAVSIVPALSKAPAASTGPHSVHRTAPRTLPPGTKSTSCYDGGSYYQCCTNTGYCCTWYGPGSPICRYAP
jgi:hypothetical protein